MDDNQDDHDGIGSLFKDRRLTFLLLAAGTASLVVTIYHLITVYLCKPRYTNRRQSSSSPRRHDDQQSPVHSSAEMHSAAELIPAHKYEKGEGGGVVGDDVVCAVCLSEFEDGEELKTLPECLHSFHAACIDVWLFSRATCPVCRGDATPSPSPRIAQPPPQPGGADVGEASRLDLRVVEDIVMMQPRRASGWSYIYIYSGYCLVGGELSCMWNIVYTTLVRMIDTKQNVSVTCLIIIVIVLAIEAKKNVLKMTITYTYLFD